MTRPQLILGIDRDITARKQAEAALRSRERQQAAVAELGQAAVAGVDLPALLQQATTLVARTLELEHVKIIEHLADGAGLMLRADNGWQPDRLGEVTQPGDIDAQAAYTLVANVPVIVDDLEHEARFTGSRLMREHQIASSVSVVISGHRQPFGILAAYSTRRRNFTNDDVHFMQSIANVLAAMIERKRFEAELEWHTFYDALTGLPNRALFVERLRHALARMARHPNKHFAVLFLDLDRFKTINDSFGPQAGDTLLIGMARRLEACLRPGDTVARLGGDQFAILLEDSGEAETVTHIAERIREATAQPFDIEARHVVTTFSTGIVIGTNTSARPDEILRDADIALHRAKELGRARYAIFDIGMHTSVLARIELEADLRRALEHDEFLLHYQPIVALDSTQIIGAEALVRWEHPTRGRVSPADFIPLAEETGLIVPLGTAILRMACREARAWHDAGFPDLYVSVNLSARQFQDPSLRATIAMILAETGLNPHRLELEITESSAMDDAEAAAATLQDLKSLGVHLSLDDFGTGYSSLSYLKRFPITTIKIDRAFVRDLTSDANDAAIVTATIAMAHGLHLLVVAEGVETDDQLTTLHAQRCDRAQGYYFGRPEPSSLLLERLGLERVVGNNHGFAETAT